MNRLQKILLVILGLIIGTPVVAWGINITVPSSPSGGYFLVSTSTGSYISTTTDPAHFGSIYTTSTATSVFSGPLSLTSTTGTTTIASGQGFTIGTSQFLLQQGSGNVGIATTSPGSIFSIGNVANFTSATSTFYGNGFLASSTGNTSFNFGVQLPSQAAGAVAGANLNLWAADAVAGSSVAGGANGGAITFKTGNGNRFSSGGASGGAFNVFTGTGVGVGGSLGGSINLYSGSGSAGGNAGGGPIFIVGGNGAGGTTSGGSVTIGTGSNAGGSGGAGVLQFAIGGVGTTTYSSTGLWGISTTTPFWALTVASSTGPQIGLTDTSTGLAWTLRNISGSFYLATSTATATSTMPGLALDTNGFPTFSAIRAASGSNCLQTDTNGKITNTGSACSSGGGVGSDPFTHTSVYGQTTSATSTLLALTGSPYSLVASSTVNFVNASTTNFTILPTGNLYITPLVNSLLWANASSVVAATSTPTAASFQATSTTQASTFQLASTTVGTVSTLYASDGRVYGKQDKSFTIASSTLAYSGGPTATTTYMLWNPQRAITITDFYCKGVGLTGGPIAGTSTIIVGSGTASSTLICGGQVPGTATGLSIPVAARGNVYFEFGNGAGTASFFTPTLSFTNN